MTSGSFFLCAYLTMLCTFKKLYFLTQQDTRYSIFFNEAVLASSWRFIKILNIIFETLCINTRHILPCLSFELADICRVDWISLIPLRGYASNVFLSSLRLYINGVKCEFYILHWYRWREHRGCKHQNLKT
jgi:hypothetical protein